MPSPPTALEQLVRGQLALLVGDHATAARALRAAWADATDDDVAARAAGLRASITAMAGRGEEAREWARRALRHAHRTGGDTGHAHAMLASAWALDGDLAAGLDEVSGWAGRLGDGAARSDALHARGTLCLWDGRLDEAADLLAATVDSCGPGTPLLTTAGARYSLADVEYRRGYWDRALAGSLDLIRDLDDAEHLLSAPMAHAVAAFVLAGRGEGAAARRHLELATAALTATNNMSAWLWVTAGTARVAIAEGDPAAVVATLQPFSDLLEALSLPEGVQPWRADLVEAHVAAGNLEAASRELERLGTRQRGGGAHVRAGALRAAGVLADARGDEQEAERAFRAGLDESPLAAGAFVRARLELAAGSFARRRGRRRAAAELLEASIERFTALGAAPFRARAERELAACGLQPHRRDAELTATEAAVAELVAAGRTNREAAQAVRQRPHRRITPGPHLRQARRALAHRVGQPLDAAPVRGRPEYVVVGPQIAGFYGCADEVAGVACSGAGDDPVRASVVRPRHRRDHAGRGGLSGPVRSAPCPRAARRATDGDGVRLFVRGGGRP